MKITEVSNQRDYNSYARQMEENSEQKFSETASFIQPGKIGDIGCATGTWLKFASEIKSFGRSELSGVEVAKQLCSVFEQRKRNGDFLNDNVSLIKKDALGGLVFAPGSMDCIHTSSLTHEIYSYTPEILVQDYMRRNTGSSLIASHKAVGAIQLRQFISNRYMELRTGGLWINRDVVGPEQGDKKIYLGLSPSLFPRFLQFAHEYRCIEGYKVPYTIKTINDQPLINVSLNDAWEFATKKDYVDNWKCEMHETFCFWSFSEWIQIAESCGFEVLAASHSFTNPWIIEQRLEHCLKLFEVAQGCIKPLSYPPTNMILVMRKRG